MQILLDIIFAFPWPSVPGSKCRVRIFQTEGERPVVVASHIRGSSGTSMSNASEEVATELLHRFPECFGLACGANFADSSIEPIWIEYYPEGCLDSEFEALVHTVTYRYACNIFINPCWTLTTLDDVQIQLLHGLILD